MEGLRRTTQRPPLHSPANDICSQKLCGEGYISGMAEPSAGAQHGGGSTVGAAGERAGHEWVELGERDGPGEKDGLEGEDGLVGKGGLEGEYGLVEKDGLGEAHARETYGPLEVERRVKDDGRALIIYTHRERGQT
jgi:hypothetical protein